MPNTSTSQASPECFAVECNFPRQLAPAEIERVREYAAAEVYRVLVEAQGGLYEGDPDRDIKALPFGESIITMVEEGESMTRGEMMRRQLEVALRYLVQSLEVDGQICGDEEQGIMGVRLPVRRVRQQGRHHVLVRTKNSWGSTDFSEPDLQERLRKQFTGMDSEGRIHFDREGYERTLREFLSLPPDTSADLPVLNEEDHVDLFDRRGHFIGRALVRDVAGDQIRLHLPGSIHLRPGCTMRKKSNRRSLEAYRGIVHDYCCKLGIEYAIEDRDGQPYQWRLAQGNEEETGGPSAPPKSHRIGGLSIPEQVFFGRADEEEVARRVDTDERAMRGFGPEDIPRTLADDPEQCTAFALGAVGYPCYLIQGPPGTGKTTVASELARSFQRKGLKTLILSHSNRGLDVLLRAARKRGVNVHRGGAEVGVCARDLQDVFIRRGLTYPHRADFLESQFDEAAYAQACGQHVAGPGLSPPKREDFMKPVLDRAAWRAAWQEFDRKKQEIIDQLKEEEGLVAGVTLNSLISDEIIEALEFDVVIVDEASKGYIHEMLPALAKAGKQIIFIGDHKQLGNIEMPSHFKAFLEDSKVPVHKRESGDRDFETSWDRELRDAEKAEEAGDDPEQRIGKAEVQDFDDGPFQFMAERTSLPQVMLRTNRRSLENIVALVGHAGYGGRLKAGRRDPTNPDNKGKLVWVDTSARPDRYQRSSGVSKVNPLEARLIARRLYRECRKGALAAGNFGVITMYRAQGTQVRKKAKKIRMTDPRERAEFLTLLQGSIATVDAFQGSERNAIHLATTRSNDDGNVGFLDNVRRINVGCSRARDMLVIYGDRSTLIDNNPDPESRAYFEVAYEVCRLRGQIVDVFPSLPGGATPEAQKSQTHAAKLRRARRRWKRQHRTEEV